MTDKNLSRISDLGFTILDYCDSVNKDETLYVTGCCAKKSDAPKSKVRDLYLSPRCQSFMKNIEGYNAGIISEKYGLVRLDHEVDNYDFGPNDLKANPELIPLLQEKLKTQIKETGVKNLIIFGPPLMTMGFMNLLSKVECNKYLCFGTNRLTKESVIVSKPSKSSKKAKEPIKEDTRVRVELF